MWASKRKTAAGIALVAIQLATLGQSYNFNYDNEYFPNPQHSIIVPDFITLTTEQWESVLSTSNRPIDFPNLPDGCVCLNEQQSNQDCTVFVCQQTCNLQIGSCDAFCCTDPDCTTQQISQFTSTGSCLPDGSSGSRVTRCTNLSTVTEINMKLTMFSEVDNDPLSGLLCVSIDNDPFDGGFFIPQNNLINSDLLFDRSQFQGQDSFREIYPDRNIFESFSFYPSLSPIRAAVTISGFLQDQWGGYLSLATAGIDGECSSANYAQFGQQVQQNRCVQSLGDSTSELEALCNDDNSVLSWVFWTALSIATRPNSSLEETSVNSWIPVEVRNVYLKNANTGETVLSSTSPPPSTAWDAGTSTCSNALVGVHVLINFSANNIINGVFVDFTISDLVAPGSGSIGVTQSYTIEFNDTNRSQSAQNASLVNRIVSGNPGYIQGLPVQAGNQTLDGDKSAILLDQNGLSMLLAAGPRGECVTDGGLPWWDQLELVDFSNTNAADSTPSTNTPVFFGVNTVSTCTVSLSQTDFETGLSAWCKDWSNAKILNIAYSHVGIYSNANPLNIWEWIPIQRDVENLSPTAPSSVSGSLICENIIQQSNLEIVWANSGQTSNPQPQILAIRNRLGQANWEWNNGPGDSDTQQFTFSQSVTFLEYTLPSENYKPPSGILVPQLAYDIFYPFDIIRGSSGNENRAPIIAIAILMITREFLEQLFHGLT